MSQEALKPKLSFGERLALAVGRFAGDKRSFKEDPKIVKTRFQRNFAEIKRRQEAQEKPKKVKKYRKPKQLELDV